ncbi:hypothetical protein V8C34DRAFT_273276 [Trichoderma compactum]
MYVHCTSISNPSCLSRYLAAHTRIRSLFSCTTPSVHTFYLGILLPQPDIHQTSYTSLYLGIDQGINLMYVLLPLRTTAAASITVPPWQNILSRWCYVLHRCRQLLRTDLLLTCSGACNAVLTYRLACSALAQPSPSRFKTREHRSIVRTQSRERKG